MLKAKVPCFHPREKLVDLLVPKEGVRPLVVIDLSEEQTKHGYTTEPEETSTMFWNETIQALVVKRLLEGIRSAAERLSES